LRALSDKAALSKMGKLPEKSGFNTSSQSKRDQRKNEIESYLQNLISVFKNHKALETFLTSDYIEPPVNNNQNKQSIKEGYLNKKGKNYWKSRYFVLTNNSLNYFDSCGGNYVGSVKLKRSQLAAISNDSFDVRHGFIIVEYRKLNESSSDKLTGKHILCAENDEERDEWIAAISQVIDIVNQEPNEQVEGEIVEIKSKSNNVYPDNEIGVEPVRDFEDYYQGSNYGSVESLHTGYENQMYVPSKPIPGMKVSNPQKQRSQQQQQQ